MGKCISIGVATDNALVCSVDDRDTHKYFIHD